MPVPSGRMPATELADGALVLIGGTLLITPGFMSDLVGLAVILPLTRPLARRALARVVSRRLTVMTVAPDRDPRRDPRRDAGAGPEWGPGGGTPPRSRPDVVQGEVVDDP